MSELFEKSIRTLELPAVLELLAAQAVSDEAKDRARKLWPKTDYDEVSTLQDQTEAARAMLPPDAAPAVSPTATSRPPTSVPPVPTISSTASHNS